MALGALVQAIGVALGYLSQHPTARMMAVNTLRMGILKYQGLNPQDKAKVNEIIKQGVKLVVKLGISDAADWTRMEVHTLLPNLPDAVAEAAAHAVEMGGEKLLEATEDEKKKR